MLLRTAVCLVVVFLLTFQQSQSFTIATNHVNDPLLNQLDQLTKDLWYMSESDYPLEPISILAPLTDERLIEVAQKESPTGTHIEQLSLTKFLRYHTSEENGGMLGDLTLTRRFQALESFMMKELNNVNVYRVGGEPRIVILALGTTKDGQRLVGFRTVSIET